jgi:uroporphyrinogen-III synthase
VTITSSEALDNLWSIADDSLRAMWRALPTFAPHPRIVAHARAQGSRRCRNRGGDAGLIAGLLEWTATHPRQKS